jgi:hypothetical protein
MGGLVPSTSDIRGLPSTGGVQLMPSSELDLAVLELLPSVEAAIPVNVQDPHLLLAPSLLGNESFSWLPKISEFSVSTRVLPVRTSLFFITGV